MPYVPHTPEQVREMLDVIGVRDIEDLFTDIPAELRPRSFELPEGLSEMQVLRRIEELAQANKTDVVSFLGGGVYDHFIPDAVNHLSSRGEFYTAYTPYQPEASQGTLQAIFEYQTSMARLTGMECCNASVYDGGSALFEAMMMAVRARRKTRLVIDEALSPIHRIMLDSYTRNLHLDMVTVPHKGGRSDKEGLMAAVDKDTAAVIVQNPNFFGCVDDYASLFETAHEHKALGVISVYPVMQALLKTPGEMGADIAVAEGQSLGLPMSFGGPYLGVMACTKKMVRQMPGRIVGRTKDTEGRTGYVLTLQAREQHIRRAKATSNICSNQALCALRAQIHLSLLGPEGLRRSALLSMDNAHYAAKRLAALEGVELLNDAPFCNEFAVRLPMNGFEAVDKLTAKGFVPGFPAGRFFKGMDDVLLVACTEKHTHQDIGLMVELLGGIL